MSYFPSLRTLNLFAFFACALLLITAFFLQYVVGVQPCALCIVQRFLILFLGVLLLVAVLHHPRKWGITVYGGLITALAGVGVWLAARQVWLEHRPPGEGAAILCMPDFSYMLAYLPWRQTLFTLFHGDVGCGVVTWRLFGWSIASWTLSCFILLGLLGVWQIACGLRNLKG